MVACMAFSETEEIRTREIIVGLKSGLPYLDQRDWTQDGTIVLGELSESQIECWWVFGMHFRTPSILQNDIPELTPSYERLAWY